MIKFTSPPLALILAIAASSAAYAPALAQDRGGSVSDFQLPPAPTPTPTPQVQGPVDPDAPSTRPRVITSPRPTPSPTQSVTPAPAATLAPAPTATAPSSTNQPAQQGPTRRFTPAGSPVTSQPQPNVTPAGTPQPTPSSLPSAQPTQTLPGSSDTAIEPQLPPFTPTAQPSPADGDETAATSEFPVGWPWWIWLAAIAAIAMISGVIWRVVAGRRNNAPPAVEKPQPLERPSPRADRPAGDEPAPASPPAAPIMPAASVTAPDSALDITFTPTSLAMSMMNATLHYRLEIAPGPNVETDAMMIGADMVAAHASLPVNQQLADPAIMLEPRHSEVALKQGEKVELSGTIILPLASIRPIKQGSASLFVPLLRLTFDNVGTLVDPMTFVLGEQSKRMTGNLQPIRLDTGPRTIRQLIARRLG